MFAVASADRSANRGHLRQPEIQNLGVAALGDKNVGGLDVAMDDSFGVGGIERVRNLDGQRQNLFDLHRWPCDPMLQRHAIQKLHGDEGLAVLFANFVDGADVGMVQGRSRLRLALKPGQRLGIFGHVIRQELQGDKAVQGYILGLVNHAHPAAAEFLDDAVVRDGLADHGLAGHGLADEESSHGRWGAKASQRKPRRVALLAINSGKLPKGRLVLVRRPSEASRSSRHACTTPSVKINHGIIIMHEWRRI